MKAVKKYRENKMCSDILFRNLSIFTESKHGVKNLKTLIFQLALNGKLDFQKLSEGRIKKPLQTLIKEQKYHLKKDGIAFEEQSDSIWPMMKMEKILEKVIYTNKIKKTNFLKKGMFPIIDQSKNLISGYWNNPKDVFKINRPIIIFGDHTCCFKYIDFNFVLGADGVKIIQASKKIIPIFLYYLLLNTKIKNLGYSRHFKALKYIKIPLPPFVVQKEIIALMKHVENIEKQIQEEKNLSIQFSKSLSYI